MERQPLFTQAARKRFVANSLIISPEWFSDASNENPFGEKLGRIISRVEL